MNAKTQAHFEEQEKKLFEFMGLKYPYIFPKSIQKQKTDPEKILCISDPHEPYSNEHVFIEAWKNESDAETVIMPGDLGDYYSKSRFRKSQAGNFAEELRAVFCRMEWLSIRFKNILIMVGNHDDRPQKKIQDLFSVDPSLLILTEMNLLQRFAINFPNVKIVGHQVSNTKVLTHIYQHGDMIFTHGEISALLESTIMQKLSQYLFEWKGVLGLKPYRIICQGHNHRALDLPRGTEHWYMLPTASDPYSLGLDYALSSRMQGKPPQLGYSVFFQKNGVTETNRSHHFLLKP